LRVVNMNTASPIDLGLHQRDRLTYWLVRLGEALQRLNHGLLRAGSSPGAFATHLSGDGFEVTALGREIRFVANAMRRFAGLVSVLPRRGEVELSVWEDLMASLKLMLSACALESELWLTRGGAGGADPIILGELSATVHAIEGLCARFDRLH
jgi:hypothetical protein